MIDTAVATSHMLHSDESPTIALDRRSNRAQSLAETFVPFLASQPALPDVAQFLVALLSWPIGAQGAIITDGRLGAGSVLGAYVESVPGWFDEGSEDPYLTVQRALEAATSGQPVIWTTGEPDIRWPVIAWPLGSLAGPVGALVVILNAEADEHVVFGQVRDLASSLAIYLAGLGVRRTTNQPLRGTGMAATWRPSTASELTSRQKEVLTWMAKGLTMRQIGHRIGFSDSTVRAESLAIYRSLGVNDRAAALLRAQELGVFDTAVEAAAS